MSRKRNVFLLIGGLFALLVVGVYVGFLEAPTDEAALVGTIGVGEKEAAPGSSAADPRNPSLREIVWRGADGEPFGLQNEDEIADFLEEAKIVSSKRVDEGINRISKVLLEKDGLRLHAAFREVKLHKTQIKVGGKIRLNFKDDFNFEIAAFRVGRMLGLKNIPPAVARRISGQRGSLQVWVEGAMTERERLEKKLESPYPHDWNNQVQTMRLFDQLISNEDRNQGNVLIDPDWRLWMIDHTRSFRDNKQPTTPQIVLTCSRSVWEKLLALNAEDLKSELRGVLTGSQIKALLQRRDQLVEHLRGRISRVGEDQVLL